MSEGNHSGKKGNNKRHLRRIRKAQKKFAKNVLRMVAGQQRRNRFLQRNDDRVRKARQIEDEALKRHRERLDRRIEERRERIETRYVRGDARKEERLKQQEKKTDAYIASYRKRQDARIGKYRSGQHRGRRRMDKRAAGFYAWAQKRLINRLSTIMADTENLLGKKRFRFGILVFLLFVSAIIGILFSLKRRVEEEPDLVYEVPLLAFFEQFDFKEYDTLDITEEELLWDLLMEHYEGNETAVLGVMCNLKAESEFRASNLENYNNQIWDVDDETYLEEINGRYISKMDFLESRYQEETNGYRNKYHEWVNLDGGYGYAQYTSFEKKEMLFDYAEKWFGVGGPGEDYKFNIADPKMQAHFIIYLLESEQYRNMDARISKAPTVVDACYIWLKKYEIPKDPYKDNYYTLSFKRAAAADEIREFCTRVKEEREAGETVKEESPDEGILP